MFYTETHMHTAPTSMCGKLTPEEMVEQYHEKGYRTLFVSDHFFKPYFDHHPDLDFHAAVDRFLDGYRAAKKAAERYGMNVLLSAEYAFNNDPGHYLVYGLTEEFLHADPDVLNKSVAEFHALTQANGMLLIQAHPYRANSIPRPLDVDGIEVYNPNPRHFVEQDEPLCEVIAERFGLFRTGGSDAHRPEDVAGSGMGSEFEIKTAEDYIRLVREGSGTVLHNR